MFVGVRVLGLGVIAFGVGQCLFALVLALGYARLLLLDLQRIVPLPAAGLDGELLGRAAR